MEKEILIAIISGIVASFVALISLLTAFLTNRSAKASQTQIALLNQALREKDRLEIICDEEFLASLNSLKSATVSIQRMKDELLLVLNSNSNTLDPEEGKRRVAKAREELFQSYKSNFAQLAPDEGKAFHDAKDIAFEIEQRLELEFFKSGVSEETRMAAREFAIEGREQLSEAQSALRDYRFERLLERSYLPFLERNN